MKALSKRALFGLLPAVLAALVLGVPTAAPDLGLQTVNLSCNDSTNFSLALDTTSLASLTDAVSAVNLYPAGDPALACGLTQTASTPSSSSADPNGPHDFAVGGGQLLTPGCGLVNFSFSARVANDAPVAPGQPGVGGTYNGSAGATSSCGGGSFTAKVDCVHVSGNMAQFTAQITHAKGAAFFGSPGDEVVLAVTDNTPDEMTVEGGFFASGPCSLFDVAAAYQTPIARGNINVHDA
jgi:hypothetical protein